MNKLQLLGLALCATTWAHAQDSAQGDRWGALQDQNAGFNWNCADEQSGQSIPCYAIKQKGSEIAIRVTDAVPAGSLTSRSVGDGTGFKRHYFSPDGESVKLTLELDIPANTYHDGFNCFVSGIKEDGSIIPLYAFVTGPDSENSVSLDISTPPDFDQLVVEFTAPDGEEASIESEEPAAALAADYRVFPNPFQERLTIGTEKALDAWELFDATGKLLAVGTDHQVSTERTVGAGVYLLRIHSGSDVSVKRVVRQ